MRPLQDAAASMSANRGSAAYHRAMPSSQRPMPPWLAVKSLFAQLLELPASERSAALQAQPEAVRCEVLELLAQHRAEETGDGNFLAAAPLLQVQPALDRRGQRLGSWELVAQLGSGGMGEVWEARRADGAYEARAAIKVLRNGFDSDHRLERFALEQRLLARLNHPHIARLLDAGRTEDGRPYFVLEAVDGQPIDEACRGQRLGPRLRLFLQLADAVAHAHRQQLIHRDLKPANVLVTAEGQVKLLDFGIAQAIDLAADQPEAGRCLTPAYASPEQVRGDPATAASDVYSLGVLLYRLLTSNRPYGHGDGTAQAALRAVLFEAPTLPSAAGPGADPGVARSRLVGDLDAIVMKALAKEVDQRYASVDALAADLRAFRAGEPVSARPRTVVYLAAKFMRRHRGTVLASLLALLAIVTGLGATAWQARDAAAALALLALVAGVGTSTWQARAAATARDEARARLAETHGLVRDIVMRFADTVTFLPGGLKMKAELLKDTIAYLERLAVGSGGDPVLTGERAKAYSRLADLQLSGLDATLDEPEDAARNAEQALVLFPGGEPLHRNEPDYYVWWARAMRARWHSRRDAGDAQGALETAERTASFLRSVRPRFPNHYDLRFEYGSALIGIGQILDTWMLASLDRPQQALEVFAEAETVYRALQAEQPGDGDVAYQLGTVAGAQQIVRSKQHRPEEAAAHGRRAVAYREQALALRPDNTAYRDGVAGESNNLTLVLLKLGLVDEALAVSERGEAVMQALEADDPSLPTWTDRRRLFALHRGRALLAAGRAEPALLRLQEALRGLEGAQSGPQWRRRGWCQIEIARALQALGRDAAAAIAAAQVDLQAALAVDGNDAQALALQQQARALLGPAR